jgi:hypothetical protein
VDAGSAGVECAEGSFEASVWVRSDCFVLAEEYSQLLGAVGTQSIFVSSEESGTLQVFC